MKNSRIIYRINRDGAILPIVQLSVADERNREKIILAHFVSFRNRYLGSTLTIGNITERDNPWDFTLNNDGEYINVEITAIAENEWKFMRLKRESVLLEVKKMDKIRLRDLRKYDSWFGLETGNEYAHLDSDTLVDNPYQYPRIYNSGSGPEDKTLRKLILEAINRKNSKSHKDKENTIIIIDNKCTLFTEEDLLLELEDIAEELTKIPFPEIYFYVGYGSHDDGTNAAYAIYALKQPQKLVDYIAEHYPDKIRKL